MADESKYTIGIDLGTTNSTLAYIVNGLPDVQIEQLSIPQVTGTAQEGESLSLPSFLYFPLPEELDQNITALSGFEKQNFTCGIFARERGAELANRMISSAKSWLCHPTIDKDQPVLPITSDDSDIGVSKMSPLTVCSRYLSHLKNAWNIKHPKGPFNKQQILICVPASFDPRARQLIQEAAVMADYPAILLLEEPQAAFYSWLHVNSQFWRKQLKVDDHILVIDIGGGTTDFSLISVNESNGELTLERKAVGSHLLLGGDNIDLALALTASDKLSAKNHSIDDKQLQALIHASRRAKEELLGENPPNHSDLTIMGRSSKLIGNTLKTKITREEALNIVIDGFFPLVSPEERSINEKHLGLSQLGLSYTQDARITAQLAKFLSMTGENNTATMEHFIIPTAVLFNGGTLKSLQIRQRLMEQLNAWADLLGKPHVLELPDADLDFAVSKGAAYYGIARADKAIRIRSGTSRSYYIGVQDAIPAIPGRPTPLKAICVVPFGMEEGSKATLEGKEFTLMLGETATFRFFSRATELLADGTRPSIGTAIRNWQEELTELHPVETLLEKGNNDAKTVSVTLNSYVTELGVLELWCHAKDGRKWKLEFEIRG